MREAAYRPDSVARFSRPHRPGRPRGLPAASRLPEKGLTHAVAGTAEDMRERGRTGPDALAGSAGHRASPLPEPASGRAKARRLIARVSCCD